jgi:ketosteroid isomerase-like protein
MKKTFYKSTIIILLSLMFSGCLLKNTDKTLEKQQVINADIAFSDMSKKDGMKKAFLYFADQNAVLLRQNSMPTEGYTKIAEHYSSLNDEGFDLTWKPLFAEISESGELGYTYGTFLFVPKTDSSAFSEGTYATVWKKQTDGSWKWVLDTGNDGLKKK